MREERIDMMEWGARGRENERGKGLRIEGICRRDEE